jgi:hypothetical protein
MPREALRLVRRPEPPRPPAIEVVIDADAEAVNVEALDSALADVLLDLVAGPPPTGSGK